MVFIETAESPGQQEVSAMSGRADNTTLEEAYYQQARRYARLSGLPASGFFPAAGNLPL